MITREMFLEALKSMKEASAIIEAYHMQFEESEKPREKYKDKNLLVVGDFVQCVEVHGNSKGTLTEGEQYEVKRTEETNRDGLYFTIKNDQGKLRKYNSKNTQFKALN
ncbi:hypothetical protein [Flavobacterium anhuiense]|uniref:hypothetical protein n=1 Tax=Flavobacterium anhuiense TaxID=459526 RepID=UPI0020264B7C|nr:hypothetical protein [Flavobacterium anhuiense]URM37150.1 hypothetical protein LLY39_00735 [Flavobacterium anhuiense]